MSATGPRALVLVVAAAVLGTGGCGLSEHDRPQRLAADDIPTGLLEETTTTSSPTSQGQPVDVYVIAQDEEVIRLHAVERRVETASSVQLRIKVLLAEPPTADEQDEGLASRIPPETELNRVEVSADGSIIVIDLSAEFSRDIQGQALRAALAQLVWTATEPEGLERAQVAFEIEGEPTTAIDAEGNESETVSRADYVELRPEG